MQREGDILMKTGNMRNGFSMITAVAIILMMSSVAALVMNLSGKTVKSTTTQYQSQQAELYAISYTEYAIMAVTANDRSVKCLENIYGKIGDNPSMGLGYKIRTHISYITNASVETSKCSNSRVWDDNVSEPSMFDETQK